MIGSAFNMCKPIMFDYTYPNGLAQSLLPEICHGTSYLFILLQSHLEGQAAATAPYRTAEEQTLAGIPHFPPAREVPRLAVVLMAAGTRGDVQPFIALSVQLKVSVI